MPRAQSTGTIAATPEQVWALLKDYGRIDRFVPPITHSELVEGPDQQVGAIRRLTLADGGTVDERLLDIDDSVRQLSYEFAGENPFGARNYRATVRVSGEGDTDGAFVEWWADFDADTDAEEGLVELFGDGVFASGIDGLRDLLTTPDR